MNDKIRIINNWPKKGVNFLDITPALADAFSYKSMMAEMIEAVRNMSLEIPVNELRIISPEARGFLFGTTIASHLDLGFIPARKPGKLPEGYTYSIKYETEYSTDEIFVPKFDDESVYKGKYFVFVDDVYATGGTYKAVKQLVEQLGGIMLGAVVYIDLPKLHEKVENLYSVETYIKE